MKIVVPNLKGVTVDYAGVTVDLSKREVLAWIDMLAAYKAKLQVQAYVEPEVPHSPPPVIGQLLDGIFKGKK